jgi:hypothetical protein
VLAELVRTDRARHRPVAGDSEQAGHLKVLARSHQNLIWVRQRQANLLRSTPRELYSAALRAFSTHLFGGDALAVLAIATTPAASKALSEQQVEQALRTAGRQRNLASTASKICAALRTEQLTAQPLSPWPTAPP